MFIRFGINNLKSIHTLPLEFLPLLGLHILSLPLETLRLLSLVSLMTKTKRMIVDIFFSDFKRAGQKVEGFYILYRYGDFTLYFLSRSFAVCERNAGHCEKRPDCIT